MDLKAVKPADGSAVAQSETAPKPPTVEPLVPGEAVKVSDIPDQMQPYRTAQEWRRFWTKLSFVPFVIVPVILGAVYYTFIAADRYAVETKFSVRLISGSASPDLLGSLTGVAASASTVTDSYILIDFIKSRELIDKIRDRIDLRAVYGHENADFLTRFDPEETIEELREHLDDLISIYFDSSSQIITMEVQAFTPEDARRTSEEILRLGEELVNELSEKAREDTLKSAQGEVNRIEDRLRQNRADLRKFRDLQQEIDPAKTAESQITLLSTIEGNLSVSRAELANLLRFMQDDAPSVRVLKSKIQALEEQASNERARLGQDSDLSRGANSTLSARLEQYEVLALEQEFSQKAYLSALTSLEHARLEADRQQRYLSAFVRPSTPQEALYPERALSVAILAFFVLLIWGTGVMVVYVVREHTT